MWNVWIWEGISWRVLASYRDLSDAIDGQQRQGKKWYDDTRITRMFGWEDEAIREDCRNYNILR